MDSVIYFIQRRSDNLIKIGISTNLPLRMTSLKQKHGPMNLLGVITGGVVREKVLHWCFKSDRIEGEFFAPSDELSGLIKEYAHKPSGYIKPSLQRSCVVETEQHYTISQVTSIVKVSRQTVYNWIEDGAFPHSYSRGRGQRIPKSDLVNYLQAKKEALLLQVEKLGIIIEDMKG